MSEKDTLKKILVENLQYYLNRKGISQTDMARELNFPETTVSNWMKGETYPRPDKLQLMADYFNVRRSDLTEESQGNLSKELQGAMELPLYGSVAAGALSTVDGITNENVDYISIPNAFLGRYNHCKDLFAMKVNGESMNKIIKNGSVVVAKPLDLHNYCDGDIVIFSYNNEYSLKRFAPNALEGCALFKAESNDSSFKDIAVPTDTFSDLKIYGKVIFYGTTL